MSLEQLKQSLIEILVNYYLLDHKEVTEQQQNIIISIAVSTLQNSWSLNTEFPLAFLK